MEQCPFCGKKTFRRTDILRNRAIWKCKSCSRNKEERLFPLKKKIVYLDQLAYSLILKSRMKGTGDKWQTLGDTLKQLVEDQIVVCPYSTAHERETELYIKYPKEVVELYRKYSQGVNFHHPYRIEELQLIHSLRGFLLEGDHKDYEPKWTHAFSDDPHKWSSRLSIYVDIPSDVERVEKRRALKKVTQEIIQARYDELSKEKEVTFEQDYEIEKKYLAEVIIINHEKNVKLMRAIALGIEPPESFIELLNDHLDWMLPMISDMKDLRSESELGSILKQFLTSEAFYRTPYVRIWSYLFAALNQKVRHSNRKAKRSDYEDIQAISHCLPYCDLMIIDNEFRGILEERDAPIPKQFNTAIVSGKTLEKFFIFSEEWTVASRAMEIREIYASLDRTSLF